MSPGPLRRTVGVLGLLALTPIAVLLLTGEISPVVAAQRAIVVLVLTILVGRVARSWLGSVAQRLERVERAPEGHEGAA